MRNLAFTLLLCGVVQAQEPSPLPPADPAAPIIADPNAAQISVELRFVSLPPGQLEALIGNKLVETQRSENKPNLPEVSMKDLESSGGIQLVSARKVISEKQPVAIQKLDEAAVRDLLKAVNQNERTNVLFAPKVLLFDGQTAQISDAVKRPFVTELKQEGQQYRPRIEAFSEGTIVDLRAQTVPQGLKMDLVVDFSRIKAVRVAPAGPVNTSIQVPKLESSQIALSALVNDGETLLISGIQRETEHRVVERKFGVFKNASLARSTEDLLLLVTSRVVSPE